MGTLFYKTLAGALVPVSGPANVGRELPRAVGDYYVTSGHLHNGSTYALDQASAAPMSIPVGFTADQLIISVTTAVASSVMRMGLYTSDVDGYPDALIVDAGTVDSSTTGEKSASITPTAIPAGWVWAVVVAQTAGGVKIYGRTAYSTTAVQLSSNAVNVPRNMRAMNSVSGALPASWTDSTVLSGDQFAMGIRRSS